MAANIKERAYEYTISFDSANCEKFEGGYYIHGKYSFSKKTSAQTRKSV